MDYRKIDAPLNTKTHNIMEFAKGTDNVYESVVIMSRRANQITVDMKNDLQKKLQEFASNNENLDEVFENREQIEISRYYEHLPQPVLISEQEFLEDRIYYRNPTTGKEGIV